MHAALAERLVRNNVRWRVERLHVLDGDYGRWFMQNHKAFANDFDCWRGPHTVARDDDYSIAGEEDPGSANDSFMADVGVLEYEQHARCQGAVEHGAPRAAGSVAPQQYLPAPALVTALVTAGRSHRPQISAARPT